MSRYVIILFVAAITFGTSSSARSQYLFIDCTVSTPDDTAAPIVFGLNMVAEDGIDEYDEPLPPAAPDQDLQVYLQMVTPPTPLPNRWRRDIRPFLHLTGFRVAIWSMTVESDAVGDTLTFATGLDIHEPGPYTLALIGPEGLHRQVWPGEEIEVPCTAPIMIFYWELLYDEQVPVQPLSLGSLKALYR